MVILLIINKMKSLIVLFLLFTVQCYLCQSKNAQLIIESRDKIIDSIHKFPEVEPQIAHIDNSGILNILKTKVLEGSDAQSLIIDGLGWYNTDPTGLSSIDSKRQIDSRKEH